MYTFAGVRGPSGPPGATGYTGATGATGATGFDYQTAKRRVARQAAGCPGKVVMQRR